MLQYITNTVKENLPENVQVYADLEGHKVNGLTIPPHIMVTSSRCDLVIIDNSTTPATVYLFELTICFERQDNIDRANARKRERYSCQLISRRLDTAVSTFLLKWVLEDT